ncbi:MAG: amino acid ABC transporter substrate-binding protein [Comamonadaceae bacterium]|nr:MAG: amino acid ABC transporter substrate-binding protein [Comamonadaceae bacterium]
MPPELFSHGLIRRTTRVCSQLLGWLLGLGMLLAQPTWADTLDNIKARGVLRVGVKKDVPLWGMLDPASGEIKGFEPDLARLVAAELGVKLQLVGVQTSERAEAVITGRVDMLIATLSDTPERRKSMTLVLPHYYSSGVNLLARKAEGFKNWNDLRNRRVCGRRGAFYNRLVTVTYGIDLIALYGNELTAAALRDGRCSALLHDDIAIVAMLQSTSWARDFEMPMPTLYNVPWSIALAPSERGGALENIVSRLVVGWHRSGLLRDMETQWGVPPTAYLKDKHDTWRRKLNGEWFCGATSTSSTPLECL